MKNKLGINIILISLGIVVGFTGHYFVYDRPGSSDNHIHEDKKGFYSCGMHPRIVESEPGTCPICGMNLTPVKGSKTNQSSKQKDRKIIFWRAPMNPNEIYDKPGKSKMGMELIPVYEDMEGASGVVTVDGSVIQSMNIKMELIKKRPISSIIYTNGTLETDERKEFIVTTKVNGWVEKLYVSFTGQSVKRGEKLAEIYSPELISAQQELLSLLDYSSNDDESLVFAKRKLELLDISQKDIEEIIVCRKIREYMTLYAPYEGTVISKNIVKGEMIKAGSEIMKIADLTNLWLIADVYESEINKIGIGSKVNVHFEIYPERNFEAVLSFIDPIVNPKTRTIKVRADISNNNNNLKPAMIGNVEIIGKEINNSLVIPETSVLRNGKRNILLPHLHGERTTFS